MTAKARVKQTKPDRSSKTSERARGGGYADARAAGAKATRKRSSKSNEKTRGGGYADAKAATAKRKSNAKRR